MAQAQQAYDKKLPPSDVLNEFHIDVTMDMYEIKVSIIDEVTKNEWFAHYMPKTWTGNWQDAEGVYNFLHTELNKDPPNWVQLPPFKKDEALNIIIGDSNAKHYKLAVPPKAK
eukprot:CAMPEP_0197043878 /NCGR_PEP_ID=MMETSP1384-20130603/20066_1 /TAXON_ID=29189 /ORGANISM="Ammonia sp." /LENGTH=112 /DNA_ID=CAMNT_0042475247 /DNA_START=21 /DNA_END=362 /DNA_ORIENTATION=-